MCLSRRRIYHEEDAATKVHSKKKKRKNLRANSVPVNTAPTLLKINRCILLHIRNLFHTCLRSPSLPSTASMRSFVLSLVCLAITRSDQTWLEYSFWKTSTRVSLLSGIRITFPVSRYPTRFLSSTSKIARTLHSVFLFQP